MHRYMRLIRGLSLAGSVAILVGTRLPVSHVEFKRAESEVNGVTATSSQTSVEAFLARRTGEYTTATKLFLYPSEPSFAGTASISPILDGKFIREDTFTDAYGKHSEVHLFGYDHLKNEYQAVWMDSTSRRMQMMTGTSSDSGKTVTYSGWIGVGDADGQHALGITVRQVDEDHFTVTITSAGHDGKEVPIEETKYARKK
jgi:Protein of unknown function (DUF1579)